MNHYVEPTGNCILYPVEGLACSTFTGIKADLPLLGGKYINIGDFKSLADRINNDYLEEIVANVPVVIPYPNCDYYFALILCHYFFPVCLYRDTQTTQNLCRKTCNYFHKDLCDGLTKSFNNIKSIIKSHYYEAKPEHVIFKKQMLTFLDSNCMNYSYYHGDQWKLNNEDENCFYEEVDASLKESVTCDGNGYRYKGNLSTTRIANKTCDFWSNMCHTYDVINFNSITAADQNYCRNPSGARKQPWCYVDAKKEIWEFCDIPKCPVTNGNYTVWSEWSVCSVNCTKTRSRNCTNPKPKYGGRNCSALGADKEEMECMGGKCVKDVLPGRHRYLQLLSYLLLPVIGIVVLLAILSLLVVARRKWKKANQIRWEGADGLDTSQKIGEYLYHVEDEENMKVIDEEYIENIYAHLKLFRNDCLCFTCIKQWLLSLIKENEDEEKTQEKLLKMLEGLERYAPLKKTENVDTHSKEHSEICFFDNQIVDWLRNYVSYNKVGYDKLERPHGKTGNTGGWSSETFELTEGLFSISGVPIYHRLNFAKNEVAV